MKKMLQLHVLFPISTFPGLCISGVVWQNDKSLAAYQTHTPRIFSLSSMSENPVQGCCFFFGFYPNASIHLYTENAIVATIMSFFLFIEMIRRTHWSSTQTPPTSLTSGGRKCCKPQRTREKKRGDRRCVSIAYIYVFVCTL